MKTLNSILKLVEEKQFQEAKDALEELLRNNPKDVNVLYNLGMCYSELNLTQQAIEMLNKCVELAPKHSNAFVALSFAYSKENNLTKAKEVLQKALEIDPDNPYALKNIGGIWGKLGDKVKALYFLKRSYDSNPGDAFTAYGLGVTYQELGDLENAARCFRKVLESDAPLKLKDLSKDGLREIAVKQFKSKGFRADAVFYCLGALNYFKDKSTEEVQTVTFEIGLKGQGGLDINDPQKTYQIKSMPGTFTGLQLVCYMYVGFRIIAPESDVGIDLSEEYRAALRLFDERDKEWQWN